MLQRTIGLLLLLIAAGMLLQGFGLVDLMGRKLAIDVLSPSQWADIGSRWSWPDPLDHTRSPAVIFGLIFAGLGLVQLVHPNPQ